MKPSKGDLAIALASAIGAVIGCLSGVQHHLTSTSPVSSKASPDDPAPAALQVPASLRNEVEDESRQSTLRRWISYLLAALAIYAGFNLISLATPEIWLQLTNPGRDSSMGFIVAIVMSIFAPVAALIWLRICGIKPTRITWLNSGITLLGLFVAAIGTGLSGLAEDWLSNLLTAAGVVLAVFTLPLFWNELDKAELVSVQQRLKGTPPSRKRSL